MNSTTKTPQLNVSKRGGMVTIYCKQPGTYATSSFSIKRLMEKEKGYQFVDLKEVNDARIKATKKAKRDRAASERQRRVQALLNRTREG
ncbi:hypothetical protein J4419_05050 [Candidatus Woesearchaeota archaeon]|nr:hypothetical protein [Candidatus Woesearchaeota archaeon]